LLTSDKGALTFYDSDVNIGTVYSSMNKAHYWTKEYGVAMHTQCERFRGRKFSTRITSSIWLFPNLRFYLSSPVCGPVGNVLPRKASPLSFQPKQQCPWHRGPV